MMEESDKRYRVAVPAVFPQDSAPVPGASRVQVGTVPSLMVISTYHHHRQLYAPCSDFVLSAVCLSSFD